MGWFWIAILIGITAVSVVNAITSKADWLFAKIFGSMLVAVFVLPYLLPRRREIVQVDDNGVLIVSRGRREQVSWSEIVKIRIVTTSGGPYAEDVFFVLHGAGTNGCVVSHDTAVRNKLLEQIQVRFKGVDDTQIIKAMGCTGDNSFTIWEKAEGNAT